MKKIVLIWERNSEEDLEYNREIIEGIQLSGDILGVSVDVFELNPVYRFYGNDIPDSAYPNVPEYDDMVLGFWIGFIPKREHYQSVYDFLKSRNVVLVNTPIEHLRGIEFDLESYNSLGFRTPLSVEVRDKETGLDAAERDLGFPVFVKGRVQSLKQRGPSACIAYDKKELADILDVYIEAGMQAGLCDLIRDGLILRRYHPLVSGRKTDYGFPQGREFRVLVFKGMVVGRGYYWRNLDPPHSEISDDEKKQIDRLAEMAYQAFDISYMSVDIAQKAGNMEWILVEVGDAQFSGINHINPLWLWQNILRALLGISCGTVIQEISSFASMTF